MEEVLKMEDEAAITSEEKPSLTLKFRILASLLTVTIAASTRRDGTVIRRLFNLADRKSPANPNPVNGVKTKDITIDPSRNLWFRLFTPTNSAASKLPVIVFFHGGGFAHCNANSTPYDYYCRKLAREIGAVVVSVDYRLAPEHKYPAQFEDGLDTLKFLDANGEEWLPECSDLSSCFLAGDSAGANLAHHVAVRACKCRFQQLKVGGVVAIQPFLGGEERTEWEHKELGILPLSRTDWFWKCFLPEGCNRDHEAVNVSGPNALDISSLHNFPETMVVIGQYDALQVWQRRYCDYLRQNGKLVRQIEFPKRLHGFFLFPEFTESAQVILDIKKFIDDNVNRVF